jgi:hypothetical protein
MKLNKGILYLIILILLMLLLFGLSHFNSIIGTKNNEISQMTKLNEALVDSVDTYQDEEGRWVSNKRTLKGNLEDIQELLKTSNDEFAKDKQKLLDDIGELEKDKRLINAALINAQFQIDSLSGVASEVDTVNNMITFQDDTSKYFKYKIRVAGVKPVDFELPKIFFDNVSLPNEQLITFQFDKNNRKDFPVSFTVVNSNPFYQINNIESYAIPTLQKEMLNPNKWEKFKLWFKTNWKIPAVGAIGYGFGKL